MPLKNRIGIKYGRLTVIYRGSNKVSKNESRQSCWWCICECGNKKLVQSSHLHSGATKSCGCLNSELVLKRFITHGNTKNKKSTPEYVCYSNIIQRCSNSKHPQFKDYGGRGIKVCNRWRFGENGKSGFECFLKDMGQKPHPKWEIDRRNNDKGYCKENCHWCSSRVNSNNKRFNIKVKMKGKIITFSNACRVLKKDYSFVYEKMRLSKLSPQKIIDYFVKNG